MAGLTGPLALEPAGRASSPRWERLDALRGLAIVWMALFHFCYDLSHFKLIHQNFYADPFWLHQRTLIVSLFVFTAGVAQAAALHQGLGWPRFWRRWSRIALCALLVSVGSALMFQHRFISFGVLHAMALMLIVVRLTEGWGRWLWPAGVLALLLPQFIAHGWFDSRWTNWVGLVTRKPATEDYVPLLPWLGLMWWGVASGRWLLTHRPAWLTAALPSSLRALARLGQWSLSFYMLHQPVLLGLVLAFMWLR